MSNYKVYIIRNGQQSIISLAPGTNLDTAVERAEQAKVENPGAGVLLTDNLWVIWRSTLQ